MPRRLEIRTTILEKKSDIRTRGKDANSNDLYADEALQLLEEIQQLKSNIQKTDERILGTYVKSPSKRKKKSDVPARKVAYDVLYPAIDTASSRVEEEGRRRVVRDTIVSHCLNAGGGAAAADDVARPWTSCATHFTPAPVASSQFGGPSFWPDMRRPSHRQQQQQSSLKLVEENERPAFRHDGQQPKIATDDQPGGSQQLTARGGSGFKRIYATNRAALPEPNVSGEITRGGSATGSSHDQRIEQRQQDPTAGGNAGGRGHAVDDGRDDEEASLTADGENSGHASMPLNATDLSDNLGPEWVDGAEVDDSFQPVPPDKIDEEFGWPTSAALVDESADQMAINDEQLDDHQSVPEEEELTNGADEAGDLKRAERVRHYDRDEIRQYMQRQRKERKEKMGRKASGPVCHHSRISPMKRSDMGLPDKPVVMQTKRKEVKRAEPTARKQVPAEKTKSVCKTSLRPREEEKKKPDSASRSSSSSSRGDKGIQTEPMAARQTIDEATQISARSQFDDSSADWLDAVAKATGGGPVPGDGRMAQRATPSQSTNERLASASSGPQSSARSPYLARECPAVTAVETKPKPVTNLIQKIEDLELYIGNLLEAPTFQAVQTASVHLLSTPAVERPRDVGPFASHRPSQPVQLATKLTRPPVAATPVTSHPLRRTETDGTTRLAQPTPPTRISSLKLEQFQLDTTVSTEYHPLPDHLAAFLRLDGRPGRSRDGSATVRPGQTEVASQSKGEPKHRDKRSRYVTTHEATELSSLFQQQLSRHPEAAGQTRGVAERRTAGGRQDEEQQQQQPQTYFRDFNEILQMDPNPLTERSNSWKRMASRSLMPDGADAFPVPAAPYTILSALSDELKATMNRIPRRAADNNSSDSDFQSRLSVSDISVPDAVTQTANGQLVPPAPPVPPDRASSSSSSIYSSSKNEIQMPKNGSASRTGSRDAGSRGATTHPTERHSGHQQQHPQSRDVTDASLIPLELDTTYLTLTPQYTSFEATCSLAVPLDSTCITESGLAAHQAADEANDRSMFSTKLSPIPRAVSPLTLISDSETSVIRTEPKKQSTSSSDRSERDRSVGSDNVVDDNTASTLPPPATSVQVRMKKSDDLLSRLRAEIQRDESLYRSIQQVDRLEDTAAKESSKRFRIQIDSKTRSFLEAQTDALRSIAQEVKGGHSTAFLQGSQAAMEVDRVQGRKTLDSGRQTYTSDFDEPSVPTEIPSQSQTQAKSAGQHSPKRSLDCGWDSERGGQDSSALSDASVLPPKAVDILMQEEAKQQRLLLKLREKAQVEKTLAELELLQMQKRILRAQGERDKAASIKKKQRGLLLKLQEERSRIEALRRQHKKEEQRSKGSCDYQHYDSSSWETDVSAMSNSTVGDTSASVVREASSMAPPADSSSTSTLHQVLSEAVQVQQLSSNDEAADDDAEVSHQLSRSELEGHDAASALSSLRLRAPLSPRTTTENIRFRSKFRRRHSSGSDDSINLSQNETASDVSDVESRLLALTDQLQRRQAEAQRLKIEHRRLSKEKLKAQESALIKQIEVYDRCITDLRTQLDTDAETGATANAVVAVRPVIRQPRALIRADEAKSPTSARSESESAKSLEADGQIAALVEQKEEHSSATSSISTQVHTEADESIGQLSDHESIKEPELVDDKDVAVLPVIESAASEKSVSEMSNDPSATLENQAETSDYARADVFNQTMIIKSDVQVKEELAEDISKFILDQLTEDTIAVTHCCVLKKKKKQADVPASSKSSADVLQRVSALLSTGTDAPKGNRSQLYLTTTFDIFSPDDIHSPVAHPAGSPSGGPPCDVSSAEGRDALESKLNELRIENEWIDDDLQPVASDSVPDENRDKVIQEAEALEREQKRIEQEIQRLSAGSVLYLREIPNKPPPPYTPPGQALSWQKIRSPAVAENKQIIPKSKEDVARYCRRFTEYLLDHDTEPDVNIPDELLTSDHPLQADQPAECQVNCRAFLSLLADLSRLHLTELRKRATFMLNEKFMGGRPIRSRTELVEAVESAVLVQMNYQPRLLRENQLARWSQKKRDRVDEILVRELQVEEKLWTDFSSEEVQVKHQTADAILDMLLDETAYICNQIMQTAK
ncbi:uncharacterized protein LOC130688904 [Daphnia carinata]|uniref:uncharacterized protein LOC130688904 n=1 Tax=Daphnia carinata TaxID=120202 RepID=UPI00286947A2|nr:uncharacterized protein LOC130688904 [Daphnia carinata]